MRRNTKLKMEMVEQDARHLQVAENANEFLPAGEHLSEHKITEIVTLRRKPTLAQAEAIAKVLGRERVDLFRGEDLRP